MMKKPNSQFELTAMLFDLDTPDLKSSAKMILWYLSSKGNAMGESIFPSLDTIAKKTSMSRRSVIDNLKILEEKEYIGIVKGGMQNGKHYSNQYVINLEKLGVKYDETRVKLKPLPSHNSEDLVQVNGRYMTVAEAKTLGYIKH